MDEKTKKLLLDSAVIEHAAGLKVKIEEIEVIKEGCKYQIKYQEKILHTLTFY